MEIEKEIKGINAKSEIFNAQTQGRRERKRKGKEEDEKERKRKGKREREIGSEALAETEKIANAQLSRESNPGPQQTRLMLYH